ncbi:hypothetical protein BDZ89DRAFT_443457 [Hymenopellis radicata]|nr:hypothetical protein BDZ89DRAFT_443457 [Hymenopellis radicata]
MQNSNPIFHLKLALYGRDLSDHVLRQEVAEHDKKRIIRMEKTGEGEAPLLVNAFENAYTLEQHRDLFTESEWRLLGRISHFKSAVVLLVRLLWHYEEDKWFRPEELHKCALEWELTKDQLVQATLDLTTIEEVPDIKNEDVKPEAGPSHALPAPPSDLTRLCLCDEERTRPLEDVLASIPFDDLKKLVTDNFKGFQVNPKKLKKAELIPDFKRRLTHHVRHQTILATPSTHKGKGKAPMLKQEDRLRDLIAQKIGKSIRLNKDYLRVLRRLYIVHYRCSYLPRLEDMLFPTVLEELSRTDSVKFPDYKLSRKSPFKCRADLLAYEAVLEFEDQFMTLIREAGDNTKADTQPHPPSDLPEGGDSHPTARDRLMNMLNDDIVPRWRTHRSMVPSWMQSASPGHVLTRMVDAALPALQDDAREITLLEDLLGQTEWMQSRRGAWSLRRMQISLARTNEDEMQEALDLGASLSNPSIGLVWRLPMLRCLRELEEVLQKDQVDRYVADTTFTVPTSKDLSVPRPRPKKASKSTKKGKGKQKEELAEPMLPEYEAEAIQLYQKEGYEVLAGKEIVTTIFGTLMHDVLFTDVPSAFQSQHQCAPLDTADPESFFASRKDIVATRLKTIAQGKGRDLFEEGYEFVKDKDLSIVGVRWDLYKVEDLFQIVTCIPPAALASICEIFWEDYGARIDGMPKFIVWKVSDASTQGMEDIYKFVYIRRPQDTKFSDGQMLWLDALQYAQVNVEYLNVVLLNKRKRMDEEEEDSDFEPEEEVGRKKTRKRSRRSGQHANVET